MKPKPVLNKRKRIIILYTLGLVIPGIILGFLAFRGLQNDQALREKQNQQELRLLALDLFTEFDYKLANLRGLLTENLGASMDLILISWKSQAGDNPKLMDGNFLYWPDGSLEFEGSSYPDEEFKSAQGYEFVQKNYSKALESYHNILESTTDKSSLINASFGKARVLSKSGNPLEALNSYHLLAEEHYQDKFSEQLPVGAMALLEMLKLHKESGIEISDFDISKKLASFFLDPPVKIEKSPFDYLLSRWEELEGNLPGDFMETYKDKKQLSKYLHLLNDMSSGLFSGPEDDVRYLESEEYPGLFMREIHDDRSGTGWVLKLDTLINQFIPEILNTLNPERDIIWKVETNNSINLSSEESLQNYVGINFPAGYPPWILQLGRQENSGLGRLFETSQGVLIMVFVFIMLIMIGGLVFMLHTLNQEMKLSKMKSHFISNVSHEFKTPLTSIRHMTEIMHLKRIDSEERKDEYLQSMLEQCDHLGHLIENILDFSKIEVDARNYRFESHQLDEILEDLIPVFKRRIADDTFELKLEVEKPVPSMMLDKDAILQVFFNLLDNAYKYSGNSKKIDIRLSLPSVTSHLSPVTITVRDWGLGISEKDQGRIFERFYRGDSLRTAGIKGSGIGLTIVSRIVEAHGGRIELESKLNEGSVFKVILPVKQ